MTSQVQHTGGHYLPAGAGDLGTADYGFAGSPAILFDTLPAEVSPELGAFTEAGLDIPGAGAPACLLIGGQDVQYLDLVYAGVPVTWEEPPPVFFIEGLDIAHGGAPYFYGRGGVGSRLRDMVYDGTPAFWPEPLGAPAVSLVILM